MPAELLGAPGESPGTDAKNVPGHKAEFYEYLPIKRNKRQRGNYRGTSKQLFHKGNETHTLKACMIFQGLHLMCVLSLNPSSFCKRHEQ